MGLFNRTTPTTDNQPAPSGDTPPAASGVSREEFDAKFTQMMGAIQALAERPVVVQTNAAAPPPPPPPADITDEELTEAIASGNAAGKVKELVERKLQAARAEVGREVAAVRDHGALALGELAERTFANSLDSDDRRIFQQYEREVKDLVNQCEPGLRGIVQTWEACYATIVGKHRKDLEREFREAALRQQAEQTSTAPTPGRSGGRAPNDGDDGYIPTLQEVVGPAALSHFRDLENMTEDEFIRRINRGKPSGQRYKDWNDYVTRGKDIDRQLAALASGDDEAAA